jgi:hypothetical protein
MALSVLSPASVFVALLSRLDGACPFCPVCRGGSAARTMITEPAQLISC